MRRLFRNTLPMISCLGLLASGCDSAIDSATLNGNEFTNMKSKLERIGDGSPASPSGQGGQPPLGENAEATYWGAFGALSIQASEVRAVKLNDDDYDDLIVSYRLGSCRGCALSVVRMTSSQDATDADSPLSVRTYGERLEAADLDGDGRSELVGIDPEVGELRVYDAATGQVRSRSTIPCLRQTSAFARTSWMIEPWGSDSPGRSDSPFAYQLVDVNGDKRADLVCVGTARNRDEGFAGEEPLLTMHFARVDELGFDDAIEHEWTGTLRALGDFDGDGLLDYLVQEDQDETRSGTTLEQFEAAISLKVAVAYGDGAGSFSEPLRVYTNPDLMWGAPLAVDDFDGDGISDVVWVDNLSSCHPSAESRCGELHEGTFFAYSPQPAVLFGTVKRGEAFARKPFDTNLDPYALNHTGDLDGDGAADLAQIGFDRQFGITVPPFLRVMRVVDGEPTLVSNTQLEESGVPEGQPHDPFHYRMASGHFVDGSSTQLLVGDINLPGNSATLYRWNSAE